MNTVTTRHTKKPLWLGLLALALLLAGCGFYLIRHHNQLDTSAQPSNSPAATKKTTPDIKVKTYNASTEGKTIKVPDNVDPSSIKNYNLIVETDEYKIRELNGTYVITLYAIINNPSQTDSYHQQLHDYKQDALRYLTDHNVNINKTSITYDPAEAAQY